jgi:hypothetical protein
MLVVLFRLFQFYEYKIKNKTDVARIVETEVNNKKLYFYQR